MPRSGSTPINFSGPRPNRIINGLMDFTQRYTFVSATIGTTGALRVHDRWWTYISAGHFTSATQGPTSLVNPFNGLARAALNFNAQANNAAAQGFVFQRIESDNIKDLAGKRASFSFLIRNNNFTTVTLRLYYPNSPNNFSTVTLFHTSAPQVLTMSSTVKYVKFENILLDALVTRGLSAEIIYSGFNVGVLDDTALSEVMLNEGKYAAPFQPFSPNDLGGELLACKRYFQVRNWATAQSGRITIPMVPSMRAAPTPTIFSSGGVSITFDSQFADAGSLTKDANNNNFIIGYDAEL